MELKPGDKIKLTAVVDVTPEVPVGTIGTFVRFMNCDDGDGPRIILCDFGPEYGPGGQEDVTGRWFVGAHDYVLHQRLLAQPALVLKPRRKIHL